MPYDLENTSENMYIWIANDHYRLYFQVNNRKWGRNSIGDIKGSASFFGPLIRWRRIMLEVARAQTRLVCISKHGVLWHEMTETERAEYELR